MPALLLRVPDDLAALLPLVAPLLRAVLRLPPEALWAADFARVVRAVRPLPEDVFARVPDDRALAFEAPEEDAED